MSPSNLASSPFFSILPNQNYPSPTFEQPELRCTYSSGSQLSGRTSLVGVQHQFCERQPNKTSSSNVVYNNRGIQDRMWRSLRKSTHKRALVRQRTHPAHKCIGAQGFLSKEPIPQGGMPENGQHNGGSPCEQQRRYAITLPLSTHIVTLAMVPGQEHHDISSQRTWQFEHHKRLGIEGVQRQQRVEQRPSNDFPLSQGVRNRPVCFAFILQLPRYVSWRPDPEAVHADALTMDWAPFSGCVFPPFNLILAVLNKVSQDKVAIMLVAPIWPAQPWWPTQHSHGGHCY